MEGFQKKVIRNKCVVLVVFPVLSEKIIDKVARHDL